VGILTTIQEACVTALQADRRLAPVAIHHEKLKNIENIIARAMAKLGISCVVLTPGAESSAPNAPGPYCDNIRVVVEVAENVTINQGRSGTRLPASDVAEFVANTLHLHSWTTGKTLTFSALRLVPDEALIVYHVEFKTAASFAADS